MSQKSAIGKKIIDIKKAYTKYSVIYYPKFYCKFNQIKYFWYNGKSWIKKIL